jgi:quinol monooxygenase YgiN
MIVRIVRMYFDPEKVNNFLELFKDVKEKIRQFEGCQHLELLKDVNHKNVFCTYSIWQDEEHLNKYRFSELFKNTWTETKKLFNEKPVAFSLEKVEF